MIEFAWFAACGLVFGSLGFLLGRLTAVREIERETNNLLYMVTKDEAPGDIPRSPQ